ncbi:MAG: M16 family metallopeptidase [Rhodomicrobium sp.]
MIPKATAMFLLQAMLAAGVILLAARGLSAHASEGGESAIWPQSRSDLKPDPAILYGTLPNGLRYAIMKNATPAGQVSLRLRIGSGSLQESDAQQGLAHLLEHMAFKGSKRVPQGEMVKILQRKGLAFGPDTNASTSWTQTVYMLDLPEADASTVDTGLMLLRETASELTLSAKALEPERGVVLSEERLRDTPQYRAYAARLNMLLDGQLAARRFPIGKVDVVRNAPIGLLEEYYRTNYRPDRATLSIAGDIDPAGIEEKIKALFSDWQPAGPAMPEPDLGVVKPRGLTAKLVELPGSETRIEISWAQPYDGSPDTQAKRHSEFVESLGLAVLKRRFAELAQAKNPPFLSASASYSNLLRSAKAASVTAVSVPDGWRQALAAIEQEQRRIVQYGVSQEELNREISFFRTLYEQAAAAAATRRTKDLAATLVAAADRNRVFVAPADTLAQFERTVKALTLAEVNSALGRIFDGAGPLVEMSAPAPVEGGDEALAAAFTKSHAVAVSAPAAGAALEWPYGAFGPPGTVAERTDIADLGATAVRFANGVTLTVKPTQFRAGDVLIKVRLGNGRQDLPNDGSAWQTQALVAGGLKAMSVQDMAKVLASKLYGSQFSVADDAFVFIGRTRPQDLGIQLQVMAAYVTDPAYRPEAVEHVRLQALAQLDQMEATPSGVDGRDRERLLHGGDPRWGEPSREELTAAKAGDLKTLLQGPLSSGAIEITIAGDIGTSAAIEAVAATFGAMPPRPAPRGPGEGARIVFPAPTHLPVERTHKGRSDASIAYVAWPADDFFSDVPRSFALTLAADIFKNRLIDQVRIAEGATYSPQAGVRLSYELPGYGFAWSKVETPPDKIASFYANVSRIAADMRLNGVTADELARAKIPAIERLKKAELSNEYWLQALSGTQADPRKLELARDSVKGYERVSIEDIKSAIAAYFADERAWKFVVVPAPK